MLKVGAYVLHNEKDVLVDSLSCLLRDNYVSEQALSFGQTLFRWYERDTFELFTILVQEVSGETRLCREDT